MGLVVRSWDFQGIFQEVFIKESNIWKQAKENHVGPEIQNQRTKYRPQKTFYYARIQGKSRLEF